MKKFLPILILSLLLCTVLTGCFKKTPMSAETFKDTMTDKGYQVVDVKDQYELDILESAYMAIGDAYQIEFLEFKELKDAKYSYKMNVDTFESLKGNTNITSSKNLINASSYNTTSDGQYYAVSRVENTMVYANVSSEFKDEVKDIFKELGY